MSENDWQPIETAPKDAPMLVFRRANGGTFCAWWARDTWVSLERAERDPPTHWRLVK